MRITTCFRSAMVPVQPLGNALAATVLAAAVPPLRPAAAAAAPSPVACRKRRRLRPGTIGDPVASCMCSRWLSGLVTMLHPLGALTVIIARGGAGQEGAGAGGCGTQDEGADVAGCGWGTGAVL